MTVVADSTDRTAADAALAATLFAIDPVGLGGVVVRSAAGPVRDRWMSGAGAMLPARARVGRAPPGIADDRLLGGLDLSASLAAGRPVVQGGVLASHDGGVVVLPMAERIEDAMASRICAVLDAQEVAIEREGLTARLPARIGLILLDEGAEPAERPPTPLLDRLAFRLDFNGVRPRDAAVVAPDSETADAAKVGAARDRLDRVGPTPDAILEALCAAASAFGLDSIRPPLLAARAARAHAALRGRETVTADDAAAAVRLVLAPRAMAFPADALPEDVAADQVDTPDAPSPASSTHEPPLAPEQKAEDAQGAGIDAEMLISAVQAALPAHLLERIVVENGAPRARRAEAGPARRPSPRAGGAPSAPGREPCGRATGLDLPATLRAAAPWQRLRARAGDGASHDGEHQPLPLEGGGVGERGARTGSADRGCGGVSRSCPSKSCAHPHSCPSPFEGEGFSRARLPRFGDGPPRRPAPHPLAGLPHPALRPAPGVHHHLRRGRLRLGRPAAAVGGPRARSSCCWPEPTSPATGSP